MVKAELKKYNGVPTVFVNNKIFPFSQAITVRTHKDGKIIFDEEYFRGLGNGGIRLFYVTCDTEWRSAGNTNNLYEECRLILKCVPDAYFMVRVGLHPPKNFTEQHEEECFTYNDGKADSVRLSNETFSEIYPHLYSEASSVWREKAGDALMKFCDKIETAEFSDRIIGFFFAAGGTSEWYYLLNLEQGDRYGDFSKAFKREFSLYLKEKYKTDEELKKAWRDDTASLENPTIPPLNERYFVTMFDRNYECEDEVNADYLVSPITNGTNVGSFLDVDKYARVLDFYRAWHIATAKSQVYFAKLIKDRYHGQLLTGAFYGSYGCTDYFSSSTTGGVLEILDSDYMDFLAAPGVYVNRNPGGFTGQREMCDSFTLRGKTFVVEEDTRTHIEKRYFRSMFDYYDETDAINVLKRDFGRNLCENLPFWWYDHAVGGGRYKNEQIYQLFRRQGEILNIALSKKDRTKGNEIALIYDEESVHALSMRSTKEIVEYFNNYEVAKTGVPVDKYFHNDLANPEMPDYKLYVFFNTIVLNDREIEVIHRKLAKNHATALWIYASGAINFDKEKRLNGDNVSKVTGIQTKMLLEKHYTKYRVTDDEIFKRLSKRKIYGTNNRPINNNILAVIKNIETFACPLFVTEDKEARVVARFCEDGFPAITLKETGSFKSYFLASKILNAEILREIARSAGCHIYTDSDDVLYAGKNFICIHASTDGEKKIKLPKSCSLYELYEKRYYSHDSSEAVFNMECGETLTFEIR